MPSAASRGHALTVAVRNAIYHAPATDVYIHLRAYGVVQLESAVVPVDSTELAGSLDKARVDS